MNIDTGKIRELKEGEIPSKREILINLEDLTKEQKKTMSVDLHDTKSKSGRRLQKARKNAGVSNIIIWSELSDNQKRNLRKKLKRR